MTMRAGWTFDGKHFCETWTTRRGAPTLLCFVDGKITARKQFLAIRSAAKAADEARAVAQVLQETGAK